MIVDDVWNDNEIFNPYVYSLPKSRPIIHIPYLYPDTLNQYLFPLGRLYIHISIPYTQTLLPQTPKSIPLPKLQTLTPLLTLLPAS